MSKTGMKVWFSHEVNKCVDDDNEQVLRIVYKEPVITPFDGKLYSIQDVLYFYYQVDIFKGEEKLFSTNVFDCPLIHQLPDEIDKIIQNNMKDSYMIDEYRDDDFERRVQYLQYALEDVYTNEYFYKLERYNTMIREGEIVNYWDEYVLTIGKMDREYRFGRSDKKPEFGQVVMIKNLSENDLLRLKETAISFCDEAIKIYNEDYEEYLDEKIM